MPASLREQAETIWRAAVAAADPRPRIREALTRPGSLRDALAEARRILVVGCGKAGATMARAVEESLPGDPRLEGVVNVPDPDAHSSIANPQSSIRLHPARPAGSNHPTREGVEGADRILALFESAGPEDVGLCLLSGGGSALLPAPVAGITLEDKQQVTRLLHACGATINEMNAVRKHLSRIKGGRLARAFRGKALFSLIISDVIGDPLDVIASGPTVADPTRFRDALEILHHYQLTKEVPANVLEYLERGMNGEGPETPKELPGHVHNLVLGNNGASLRAAATRAEEVGYEVLNLGSYIEGETRPVAVAMAGLVRSILADAVPLAPPVCILSGGETTVTLGPDSGKGGRNQEFALAAGWHLFTTLPTADQQRWTVLSGGTDGEDGPTDAAGAVADFEIIGRPILFAGADLRRSLERHDAYSFFDFAGGLLKTGMTQTNVMDVRVILVR